MGLLVYVFAAPGLGRVGNPVNVQNLTAVNNTMNISCGNNPGAGLDGENIVNVSFLYNESGGPTSLNGLYNAANLIPNTSTGYTIIYNTTGNQTVFFNGTVLISGLNESSRYNITCLFTNLTGWNWTSSANNVSIDRTAPKVENISILNASNIGNWSGNIIFNASANDSIWKSYSKNFNVSYGYANITSMFLNFTNGTSNSTAGVVAINKSASVLISSVKQPNKEIWWNTTYNISLLSEGFHYMCIYANDTNESNKAVANVNSSECIRFLVDIYTPPRVSNFTGFVINNSYINNSVALNVSVWDANVSTVYMNITNRTGDFIVGNFSRLSAPKGQSYETYWNFTLNTSWFPDGKYNITIYANDTNQSAVAGIPVNENNTESIEVTIDNTAPSISYTCSPSSTLAGQIVTCTCTGEDGFGGGINSTNDGTTSSSISSLVTSITDTATAGTFSRTCTAVDMVGHKTSTTTSYTITNAGSVSGTTSSGGGSTTSTSKASIAAGSSATITGFVAGSGVKSINVEVNQAASGVEIQVTKYDSAPTAVSTPKTGTYKYFQVQTQNLVNKLSKATMTIQVEKTWVTTQGIDKSNVALFKYDETAKNWNGLTTTFKSEDTTYYYYTADLTSFSYFAIASKTVVTDEETSTGGEQPSGEQSTSSATTGLLNLPYWIWTIIGLVVLAIIVGVIVLKKKR